ncbi:566_t:CDS:1 [Funneliformis geosporum]|uniref:566_t:CDS:1 n=1 Tax=Funneliformis geosporum TaxID=1117311 RepID=A0A9W4SM97_9GLOM|nr:566_t:CDS:1 [Funneliformis geosporum]
MRNSKVIKNLSISPIYSINCDDIPEICIFVKFQPGFMNIKKLEIQTSFITSNVYHLLVSLKDNSHNIQDLIIYGKINKQVKDVDLIIQLIKAQHKLSFVHLKFDLNLTPILETLSSNHSNSLTSLKLTRISKQFSFSSIQRFKNLQNLCMLCCGGLDQNVFDNFSQADFNLKSLELDCVDKRVLMFILKNLTNENLKKISFYHNTSLEVIQDLFIRCPNISILKIQRNQYQEGFISSLSVLESSLTHLSILFNSVFNSSHVYQIYDELCNISLPKLTFIDIYMPKSTIPLESYLKMTSSPLRTIIFHDSNKISMEYVDILLKFSKRRTLKIVGISLRSDEKRFKTFAKITEGYFQIVTAWEMDCWEIDC